MKHILSLIRLHQWVKNLFIFIPAFFAERILDSDLFFRLIGGFVAFSLVASSIYILNDYVDVEKDRQHPKKRFRPLASGAIQAPTALVLLGICFVAGMSLGYLTDPTLVWVMLGYFGMNVAYSFRLKQVPILDISLISIGFLLRVLAGGVVAEVPISKWLVILTFLLALLLALAKRRNEFLIARSGKDIRKGIEGYNLEFTTSAMVFTASITVVAYIMYTTSEEVIKRIGNDYLYLSSIFVILGILRYLQLALVYEKTGSPTRILLKDVFIQLVLLAWLGTFALMLYSPLFA